MHPAYDFIENFTGLFVFEVSGKEYCLNDAIVSSTVRPSYNSPRHKIQPLEDTQLLTINKRTIPLINLRKVLDPKEGEDTKSRDTRIIIVEENDEQYGLLVDRIKEIIALDTKYISTSIKYHPEINLPAGSEGHKYLEGSLEIDDRCILLLNIKPLLSSITLLKN